MAETALTRVPSWKKIGLKLKFAAEKPAAQTAPVKPTTTASTASTPTQAPQPPPPNIAIQSNTQKRNREEYSAPEAPAKRVKSQSYDRPVPTRPIVAPEPYVPKRYGFAGISAEPAGKKITFDDDDATPITAAPISIEEPEEHTTKKGRPSTLRKSVSFTPDTKAKDGETGQKYFKAWASGQDPTAIDPSAEEPEQSSPSKSPTEETAKSTTKEPKQKKAKKPKKSKSTSIGSKPSKSAAAKETETSGEAPAYIAYLQQYHSHKENWKFNKKKQNDLLKNLFNIQRLPEEYEPAIIAYVAGLQGAARNRLAEQAEEVLKSIYEKQSGDSGEDMSLSSPEARKAAYYAALWTYIQNAEERGSQRDEYSDDVLRQMREEVISGKRAQSIMEHALMMELHPEQVRMVSSRPTATPTPERATRVEKTKRRKRKTRTAGSTSSDDSSSSDSSSSDSSSSDSEDDEHETEIKPTAKRQPIFGKELLDQAFPRTKAPQQSTNSDSDSDESSSSDESSDASGAA